MKKAKINRELYLHIKTLQLDFDRSPQLIQSQPTKNKLVKPWNSKIKTRKGLNQKNIDLRVFCEKLPL